MRASKISRLPGPAIATTHAAGLTECTDSQHNARIPNSRPASSSIAASSKGLKREIPQPGKDCLPRFWRVAPRARTQLSACPALRACADNTLHRVAIQSEAKRKPLAERAAEFPAKASFGPATRYGVKGQTLASISQVRAFAFTAVAVVVMLSACFYYAMPP